MADPNTQRQGRSTSRAHKFHIFGMTLDQKELIIAAYCAFFFCVAIIGMIAGGLGGKEEAPKEPPPEPIVTQGTMSRRSPSRSPSSSPRPAPPWPRAVQ